MADCILTPEDLSIFEFAKGIGVKTPTAAEIEQTLQDLRLAQGTALLIGGLAVIHYGYRRFTSDIDILYAHADGSILRRLEPNFKVVLHADNGWHHLEHKTTGVRLELIPEGGLATYGFIPGPKTVGGEGGFISLWGLMLLKLVSGRAKDDADIVEVAKKHMDEMESVRKNLHAEHHERFDALIARARKEIETDVHNYPKNK